jgi:hypothetical protein
MNENIICSLSGIELLEVPAVSGTDETDPWLFVSGHLRQAVDTLEHPDWTAIFSLLLCDQRVKGFDEIGKSLASSRAAMRWT